MTNDASALWHIDQPRMGTLDPAYDPVYCDAECQLLEINDCFVNCRTYRCFVSIECIELLLSFEPARASSNICIVIIPT